jgi:hypothetical protein
MLFATSFWAKDALCHEFKMLSQVVEEEFAFFLGIGRKALYFCTRIKKQASFKIVFFHIELLVRSYCLGFSYCFS